MPSPLNGLIKPAASAATNQVGPSFGVIDPPVVSFPPFCFVSSRRRHTRYWRHWSSDVCSSDLVDPPLLAARCGAADVHPPAAPHRAASSGGSTRSEERRAGNECRYRWPPDH